MKLRNARSRLLYDAQHAAEPIACTVPRGQLIRRSDQEFERSSTGAKVDGLPYRFATIMSDPRLPQEITDHIIDLLHDAPKTLRQCCLASRSCVPRARKHLFGTIRFESSADLDAWRKAFPDPLNSPAYHYTHRLGVYCAEVAAAVAKEWSSMQSFSNVLRLEIWWGEGLPFSLSLPLLSILKYLSTDFRTLPPSRVFPLILSLPLLEDLDITGGRVGYDDDDSSVFHPPTSPPFTGTLKLCLDRGMGSITRRLLNLQNGLHFQTLDCTWYLEDDPRWVTALVEGCADTLQYVHLERKAWGEFHPCAFMSHNLICF